MRVTLTRPQGSYRIGQTINVPAGVARLLAARGWATIAEEEEGGSPEGPGPGQQTVQSRIINKTAGKPATSQTLKAEELTTKEPNSGEPEAVTTTEPAHVPEASAPGAPAPSATRTAEVPIAPPEDVRAMLKADLVNVAQNEGIRLDGSETKADLITRIERHRRRYSRRDMRA